MFGRFDKVEPKRFFVAGPPERRKTLLHAVRLDLLIPQIDEPPTPRGPWVPISLMELEPRELSRHVMECHKILSQADSPMSAAFAKIAEQIEKELGVAMTPRLFPPQNPSHCKCSLHDYVLVSSQLTRSL